MTEIISVNSVVCYGACKSPDGRRATVQLPNSNSSITAIVTTYKDGVRKIGCPFVGDGNCTRDPNKDLWVRCPYNL
jgi:hypothetical protein